MTMQTGEEKRELGAALAAGPGPRSRLGLAWHRATDVVEHLPWFGKRPHRHRGTDGAWAWLHGALELVPVAILHIDAQDGILFANGRATELFGYVGAQLCGAPASRLLPDLQADREFNASLDRSPDARGSTERVSQTVLARRSDGSEFLAEVTTRRCKFDATPTRLAVIVDRSERHELHRNRQELAHLTRISALGELTGSLAHELNQPLTAILSNAQAAQRFMAAEPINLAEIRETLKDIVADDCRAGEIIRRIRALVRKGDVELQSLEVGNVVRDASLLVHSDAIMRAIRMTVDIAGDLPTVRGDKVQLQQVVLNLLLNAFDAVHDCPAADRIVTVQVSAGLDATVRIAVGDRGHGLTVDMLDKIFKPFFTSKPHGLGLGLSICRNIVNGLGGRLWAESNTDRGATFYVTLPAERATGPARSDEKR